MKRLFFALILFGAMSAGWAATVVHWNFENPTGQPAGTVYDWGLGGWDLVLGPNGQLVPGKFGNGLRNTGGPNAAAGSVAKVETNRYNASQGIRGSALESVWANPEWTIELFVRFDNNPTTTPANIYQMGTSQRDFHTGYNDVNGIFWNVTTDVMSFMTQRVGANASHVHGRPFTGVNDTGWHHLAQALKTGRDYIYFDGALIDSDPYSGDGSDGFAEAGQPFLSMLTTVQKVGAVLGQSLEGTIDEFRISDTALWTVQFDPPTEPYPTPPPLIGTPTPTPTPEPTPTPAVVEAIAAWDFDVAPGSTVIPDVTGHGFDLTVGTAGAIVAGGISGNAIQNTAGQDPAAQAQVAFREAVEGTLIDEAFHGPFTIEHWLRIDIPDDQRVNSHDDWATLFWGGPASRADAMAYIHKGDHNGLTVFPPGEDERIDAGTQQLVQGTWVHYAISLDEEGTLLVWYNGERILRSPGIGIVAGPWGAASRVDLLNNPNEGSAQWQFPGSIDLLRISKGVRYKSLSFTPPTTFAEPTPGATRTEYQSGVSPNASYDMEMAYLHVATDGSEGASPQPPVLTVDGENRSYNRWIIGQVDQFGGTNRVLMRWNFPGIPDGSEITSATMRLWFGALRDEGNGVFPNPGVMTIYELTPANGAWTQAGASWNFRDAATTSTWAGGATGAGTAGTDYLATPLATAEIPWTPGVDISAAAGDEDVSYEFSFDLNQPHVQQAFQRILDGTNNYGWVMKTNFEVDGDGAASTLYLTYADLLDDTVDNQIPFPPLEHYSNATIQERPLMVLEYEAAPPTQVRAWQLFE